MKQYKNITLNAKQLDDTRFHKGDMVTLTRGAYKGYDAEVIGVSKSDDGSVYYTAIVSINRTQMVPVTGLNFQAMTKGF